MNRILSPVLLPALGLALTLGGCNPASRQVVYQSPRYASLDATLDVRSGTAPERRASPIAVLPAWIGRPIRLRESDTADSFEQMVSLNLAPRGETRENLVMVTMPRSREAEDRLLQGTAAFMAKPTEAGIRAKLETAFPGTPMQVVARPASNSYGPYGLAIGRSAHGARCLYAWQWIEQAPALDAGQPARGPLSIRIRLCRSDITLEAMSTAVNQMRLVARFEGTPIGAPIALASRDRPERPRRVRQARRVEVAMQVAREPAAVEKPEPGGRRYLGADAAPIAAPVAARAPAYAAPATAMRSTLAGLGGPTPSASPSAIAADLPSEAYRGPATAQNR